MLLQVQREPGLLSKMSAADAVWTECVSSTVLSVCCCCLCTYQYIKVYLPKDKLRTFLAELYLSSRSDKAWLALQHPLLFYVGRKKKPPVPLSIIAVVLLWSLFLPVNFHIGHCTFQRPEAGTLPWQKWDQSSVNSIEANSIVLEGGAAALWQQASGLQAVMQLLLLSRSMRGISATVCSLNQIETSYTGSFLSVWYSYS